jgi:hypothetical protein
MFITAGIMRLPLPQFILADGLAAVFGHTLLFFLAWWFGDQFKELVEQAEHTVATTLKPLLALGVVVAVGVYFAVHFYRRPVSTADPKEVPAVLDVATKIILPPKKEPAPQTNCPPSPDQDKADRVQSRATD